MIWNWTQIGKQVCCEAQCFNFFPNQILSVIKILKAVLSHWWKKWKHANSSLCSQNLWTHSFCRLLSNLMWRCHGNYQSIQLYLGSTSSGYFLIARFNLKLLVLLKWKFVRSFHVWITGQTSLQTILWYVQCTDHGYCVVHPIIYHDSCWINA